MIRGIFSQTHFWLSQIDIPSQLLNLVEDVKQVKFKYGLRMNLTCLRGSRAVSLRHLETRLFQMPGLLITQAATNISKESGWAGTEELEILCSACWKEEIRS